MPFRVRRSGDRGRGDRGWLEARFSFSFADYHDPEHTGFRVLRVLNEDVIAPGRGFGPHGHRDMEILTYMISGRLRHRDSMGEERVLGPNEVQVMSAGTGVVHSEWNASDVEPSHSVQIWIEPEEEDREPRYQQVSFGPEEKQGRLRLLAKPGVKASGDDTVASINQDARVFVGACGPGGSLAVALEPDRYAWVQILQGDARIGKESVSAGDGVAISGEAEVPVTSDRGLEVLVFDLP